MLQEYDMSLNKYIYIYKYINWGGGPTRLFIL